MSESTWPSRSRPPVISKLLLILLLLLLPTLELLPAAVSPTAARWGWHWASSLHPACISRGHGAEAPVCASKHSQVTYSSRRSVCSSIVNWHMEHACILLPIYLLYLLAGAAWPYMCPREGPAPERRPRISPGSGIQSLSVSQTIRSEPAKRHKHEHVFI
jgi:hypothetical protein